MSKNSHLTAIQLEQVPVDQLKTSAKPPPLNIREILEHPAAGEYLGRAVSVKLAVLAAIINGTPLADVGRAHGLTPMAAQKLAKRARDFAAKLSV